MAGYRIQGVRCREKVTWVKLQDKDTEVKLQDTQDTGRKLQDIRYMG